MRKVKLTLLVIGIVFGISVIGCGSKKIDKAEEFMKTGMYPQAIVLLNEEIQKKPDNAKVHFLLGKCQIACEEIGEAKECFNRAIKLDPNFGKLIGQEIMKIGCEMSKEPARLKRGHNLFDLAIKYDPALKKEIGKFLFAQINQISEDNQIYSSLNAAVSYDENIRPAAAKYLLAKTTELFKKMDYQGGLNNLSRAFEIDKNVKSEAGKILVSTFENLDENTPIDIIVAIAEESLRISPNFRNRITNSIFRNLGILYQQRKLLIVLNQLKTLVTKGILQNSSLPESKNLLIEVLNELIEEDSSGFLDGMKFLMTTYPETLQSENPLIKYLYGAYLWLSGDKNQAITVFQVIPLDVKGSLLDFISPLPPGKYVVNLSKSDDFGWGTFTFSISSIEIPPEQNSLIFTITVRNHTERKQYFIFEKTLAEKKNQYGEKPDFLERSIIAGALAANENFYLLDDFGNKVFAKPVNQSKPYFVRAPNWQNFNSQNNTVILEPGQAITVNLVFPMVTAGSTFVTFISPTHDGHQWEIKFENIILRRVKFRKFPLSN